MPVPSMYNTLNRALHIAPMHARLPVEEYLQRTLSFTLTDRLKEFDYIEWQLDNRDGLLTAPEYLATGMVIMTKMGYIDGTTPWRAFIINRLNGGVGVRGPQSPAVGENEGGITYHGRNRNAPGGRGSRKWSKRALPPPKKKKKQYVATADVTQLEMLLGTFKERRIPGKSTADVIRHIATRNGFQAQNQVIQDTNDNIDGYLIPEGWSDAEAVIDLGKRFNFYYKLRGNEFHWHSPDFKGQGQGPPTVLTYGDGQDIINIDIDADFRLPQPSSVTYSSPQPDRGRWLALAKTLEESLGRSDLAAQVFDYTNNKTLARPEKRLLLTGSPQTADLKAQQRFLMRNWNAFQINVKLVGNPLLMAGDPVVIRGTGSKLVDGKWQVFEARHVFTANEYFTYLKLKHNRVKAQDGLVRWLANWGNSKMASKTGAPDQIGQVEAIRSSQLAKLYRKHNRKPVKASRSGVR